MCAARFQRAVSIRIVPSRAPSLRFVETRPASARVSSASSARKEGAKGQRWSHFFNSRCYSPSSSREERLRRLERAASKGRVSLAQVLSSRQVRAGRASAAHFSHLCPNPAHAAEHDERSNLARSHPNNRRALPRLHSVAGQVQARVIDRLQVAARAGRRCRGRDSRR